MDQLLFLNAADTGRATATWKPASSRSGRWAAPSAASVGRAGAAERAAPSRRAPMVDVDRRILVELESIHNYLMAIGHIDPEAPLTPRVPPYGRKRLQPDADPRMLR